MGYISEGACHRELGAFSENTLHIDRAVMLQYDALCDGQSQTGAANFLGPGLVDAVESLIYFVQRVLRDAHAGILHADIEIIGIGIDRNSHFAVISVVFDRVLHKIRDDHVHLHLVDLRVDISHADHRQFDISLLGDRPHSSKDQLHHSVDIGLLDVEFGILPVHSHQCQQLGDDLVLPVHLILDIDHELAVHFHGNIVLLYQGVSQDFHRCHRCLQFMGDIGNKLLPGFVQRVHSGEHLVERIRYVLGLQKGGRLDRVGGVSRLHGRDLSGQLLKRFHQSSGKN